MPDIIRPATVDSTVVVTTSAVANQSTLAAVSPTVSATVDGAAATITAYSWEVNDATTGITGATTATPSYVPTTAGAKVITCDATILGVVYSSPPEIFVVGPTAFSSTIDAVADQSTLDAVVLDVDETGGVTPYTRVWTVNDSATGLSSQTVEGPTFTPTTAGRHVIKCVSTDAAGQITTAIELFTVGPDTLTLSIDAVADQLTLAAISLNSTVGGGVGSKTYAWTVDGVTTGLSDATAADPTFTPYTSGKHVAVCVVTDAALQTKTAQEPFVIGIAAADGGFWVVDWELDPAAVVTHDFKAGPLTLNGVTLTLSGTATVAGIVAGVWTMQPTGAPDIYLEWTGNQPSDATSKDYCWITAIDASITADNDGIFLLYGDATTAVSAFSGARRIAGVQQVSVERTSTSVNYRTTAGGGQARILGQRMAGRYSFRCIYSETALSGGAWPDPSAMSAHIDNPGGWYVMRDVATSATADPWTPSTDKPRLQFRGTNGRAYVVARLARLVKM